MQSLKFFLRLKLTRIFQIGNQGTDEKADYVTLLHHTSLIHEMGGGYLNKKKKSGVTDRGN